MRPIPDEVVSVQRNNLTVLTERLNIEINKPAYKGALLDTSYVCEIYKKCEIYSPMIDWLRAEL